MNASMIKWRLYELMGSRRMTNKEMEEKTGLSQAWVSKLKNSETMPERLTPDTLEKLCRALNCTPGDLLVVAD